jgi:hypothetical protein
MISIFCSREEGIWRGGVFHPAGRKDWPDGILSAEQMASVTKEPLLEVLIGGSEEGVPDTANDAKNAALSVLRPFLKVPEAEAQVAIAELLHGIPAELPIVFDPILDRPLVVDPQVAGKTDAPRRKSRRGGGEE